MCEGALGGAFLGGGRCVAPAAAPFSCDPFPRLHRHGCPVLCSVPWGDYRELYDTHAARLNWQRASYLSLEQQRRRDTGSSLPQDDYELALVRHTPTDPETRRPPPRPPPFTHSHAHPATPPPA